MAISKLIGNHAVKTKLSRFATLATTIVLSCMLNIVAVPFIEETPLLLGFFGVPLVYMLLGWRLSLVTSFVVPLLSIPTPLAFVAIIVSLGEVAALSVAKRFRSGTVVGSGIYWLSFAALIVYVFHEFIFESPSLTATQQYIRFTLSGIFSAIMAYFIARLVWTRNYRFINPYPQSPYATIISSMVLSVVLFASAITAFVWISEIDSRERQSFHKQAEVSVEHLAAEIETTLTHHEQIISQLAAVSSSISNPNETWNQILDDALAANPMLLTMLRTNHKGKIMNAAPEFARTSLSEGNIFSVADRDYFKVPTATLSSFISDVFQGRGFGQDLIVAISAPVINNGQFEGIIEGSLSLTMIEQTVQNELPAYTHYILIDNNKNVVLTSEEVSLSFGESLSQSRLDLFLESKTFLNKLYRGDSDRFYTVHTSTLPHLGWSLILGIEAVELEKNLDSLFYKFHLFLFIAVLSALFISRFLARKISAPVNILVRQFDNEHEFFAQNRTISPIHTQVVEIEALDAAIRQLRERLAKTFTRLQDAIHENSDLNNALKESNRVLESRVAERTKALDASLHNVKQAYLAKERFVASVSHEIKTPLNSILGTTDYLSSLPLSSQLKDHINIIDAAGRDLLTFLDQVLSISSLQMAPQNYLERTSLNELIDNIVSVMTLEANQAGITLCVQSVNQVELMANKVALHHILINLVSNAIKYSSASRIELSACVKNSTQVIFSVEDNGQGIPEAVAQTLFEPHASPNFKQRGGAGLGLYIAKQLALSMNGNLDYSPAQLHGTLFTVSLPYICPLTPASFSEPTKQEHNSKVALGKKVFLLDDLKVNLKVAEAILSLLGAETESFTSFDSLKIKLASNHPDIFLIDLFLGEMNGLQVAEELCIKHKVKPSQVYILTAAPESSIDKEKLKAFSQGVISKPISVASLRHIFLN